VQTQCKISVFFIVIVKYFIKYQEKRAIMNNNYYKIDSSVLSAIIITLIQKHDAKQNKFDALWVCMGIKEKKEQTFNNIIELYAGSKNRSDNDRYEKYMRKPAWICTTAESKAFLQNKKPSEKSAWDDFFKTHTENRDKILSAAGDYPPFCPEDESNVTLGRAFYYAFYNLKKSYSESVLLAEIKALINEWDLSADIPDYENLSYDELVRQLVGNAEKNCIKPLSDRNLKSMNIERIKLQGEKSFKIVAEPNIREEIYLAGFQPEPLENLLYQEDELPDNVRNLTKEESFGKPKKNIIAFDVSQKAVIAAVCRKGKGEIKYYRFDIPEVLISDIYKDYYYCSRESGFGKFMELIKKFIEDAEESFGMKTDELIFSVRGRVTAEGKILLNNNIKNYVPAGYTISDFFKEKDCNVTVINSGNARAAAEVRKETKNPVACLSIRTGIGLGIADERGIFLGTDGAGSELGDCPYDSKFSLEEALREAESDNSYNRLNIMCHALRWIVYLLAPETVYILGISEDELEDLKYDFKNSSETGGRPLAQGYDRCEIRPASYGDFQAAAGCLKLKLNK
jgi:hypothetical protein